jgi:hypothetical protein
VQEMWYMLLRSHLLGIRHPGKGGCLFMIANACGELLCWIAEFV